MPPITAGVNTEWLEELTTTTAGAVAEDVVGAVVVPVALNELINALGLVLVTGLSGKPEVVIAIGVAVVTTGWVVVTSGVGVGVGAGRAHLPAPKLSI